MNKHTPGPWKMHGRIKQVPGCSNVAANTLIARVYSEYYGDIENETANARLIAAAPELLKELKSAVDWHRYDNDGEPAPWYHSSRAVIAKVEGRQ